MLGERIEREHSQYLRDSQRIEDKSSIPVNGTTPSVSVPLDFESLVGGGKSPLPTTSSLPSTPGTSSTAVKPNWEDDVWGSILGSSDVWETQ